MSNTPSETAALGLAGLSHQTGLILRSVDAVTVNDLFDQLEKHDPQERAKTLEYLMGALNDTRTPLGAEPAYLNE
ncbi:MAG: hypothetical protein H0T77_07420 [Pyrinomonadaceae bacterium]|nr:hypothetical protein [Pyrinomonadaceae bacterium]